MKESYWIGEMNQHTCKFNQALAEGDKLVIDFEYRVVETISKLGRMIEPNDHVSEATARSNKNG